MAKPNWKTNKHPPIEDPAGHNCRCRRRYNVVRQGGSDVGSRRCGCCCNTAPYVHRHVGGVNHPFCTKSCTRSARKLSQCPYRCQVKSAWCQRRQGQNNKTAHSTKVSFENRATRDELVYIYMVIKGKVGTWYNQAFFFDFSMNKDFWATHTTTVELRGNKIFFNFVILWFQGQVLSINTTQNFF